MEVKMRNSVIEVGSVPAEEPCAQLGTANYQALALEECRRYRKLLTEKFSPIPDGAELITKPNRHDFGTYYEVAVRYDEEKPEAVQFAFAVEANTPSRWTDTGKIDWRKE